MIPHGFTLRYPPHPEEARWPARNMCSDTRCNPRPGPVLVRCYFHVGEPRLSTMERRADDGGARALLTETAGQRILRILQRSRREHSAWCDDPDRTG